MLLLLSGCAGPQLQTARIPRDERQRVAAAFAELGGRECPLTLDADITVEMRLLGQTEKSAGVLQYEGPSSFRYAVVDPLGRSHFIMATDGYAFTMVYNREAKAVTGSTNSRFWQEYVPPGVTANEMLLLLAGRLSADLRLKDIRGEKDGAGFWVYAVGAEGIRHEILLDHNGASILRHALKDGRGNVLFDVSYDRYEEGDSPCPRPMSLRIEGQTLTGRLALSIDRIFPGQALPPENFHITPPPHFEVQETE